MPRETLLTATFKLTSAREFWYHRIHALLGTYVLCHLCYRYQRFFVSNKADDNDMGFNDFLSRTHAFNTSGTNPVILYAVPFTKLFLPHLALQISGFAFALPNKRHPDGNRIWPQYRWEALVFCLRCHFLAFLAWMRKMNGWKLENGSCNIAPAAIIVGCTMMAADHVIKWHRTKYGLDGSRTIRDFSAPAWSRYLMSAAQFHATVHCLLTSDRLSVQIAALTVVQFAAFGMTLRRKRFISHTENVFLYSFVLVIGMLVIIDDLWKRKLFHLAICLGNVTTVLRINGGVNKYLMWCGVATLLAYLFHHDILNDDAYPVASEYLSTSSLILLLGCCFLKSSKPAP